MQISLEILNHKYRFSYESITDECKAAVIIFVST